VVHPEVENELHDDTTVALGVSTDKPVPGDYDGDGKTDVAIYRPATGQWQILTSISNYTSSVTSTLGGPFGLPGSRRLRWRRQDGHRRLPHERDVVHLEVEHEHAA